MTVVFADLVGSTVLAERLDVESFHLVIMRWFDAMRLVLERHGGTVEKFIGDAVVAVFGVPTADEDDPLRAIRAAVEMHDVLVGLNRELQADSAVLAMRITVNTGEVLSRDASVGYSLAAGEAMTVAALMQLAAEPGGVVLGEATRLLVGGAVTVDPLEPLRLKGRAEPVIAHRLLALHSGSDGSYREHRSPLVGRQTELDRLRLEYREAVATGAWRVVTVVGEAGIGKSRLVKELLAELGDEATVLIGHCPSYGDSITFSPFVEIVRQAAGPSGRSAQQTLAGLEALLEGEERGEQVARAVAALVGLGEAAAVPAPEELRWALRRFFEAQARRRPLIVVVEDVHWAEPGFLDVLEHLPGAGRAPVLLVCSARPELAEERSGWLNGQHGTAIALSPLTTHEGDDVLAHLLGDRMVPAPLRARITASAAGNPLFLIEITRLLVEQEAAWFGSDDAANVPLPASLNVLLTSRLDRLPPAEREVLDCAAVVGEGFTTAALAALVSARDADGLDTDLLDALVTTLVRKQLVDADRTGVAESTFRFAHALIREAAYHGLPKLRRAELHERLARWLETRIEGWAAEDAVIGFHLEQAYRHRVALRPGGELEDELARRAARHLSGAGRRAFAQEDRRAAINLFRRAANLLPAADPARVDLLPDLAHTLIEEGELEAADALLRKEFEANDEALTPVARARARVVHGRVRVLLDRGTLEEARAAAENAIAVLSPVGDHHGLALASYMLGFTALNLGHLAEAEEHSIRAAEHERLAGHIQRALGFVSSASVVKVLGATPASEGLRWCEARMPEIEGHLLPEARLAAAAAAFSAMLGDAAFARRQLATSRSLFDEMAIGLTSDGVTRMFWAEVRLLDGDLLGAEQEYRPQCDALEATGDRFELATVAALLAHVLADLGRYDEAERYVAMSQRSTAHDDVPAQVEWRQARAKLCAVSGQAADAVRLAHEAVELIRPTEFLHIHAGAVMGLADVLLMVGRPVEAVPVLQEAVRLYDLKGNLVRTRQAQSALMELMSSSVP